MVYFETKNPNLGKFWRAVKKTILNTFILWPFWNILWPFGILYGPLVI
jgi:hypothetical protein